MSSHENDARPEANVLLVEDSPADAELTIIAIRQDRPEVTVHVVESGDDALAFLHQEGDFIDAPTPDLILLDLNLPGRDGTEICSILKDDDDLMSIPVIIFSNSNSKRDVRAAYRGRANAYLVKPMEYTDIREAMAALLEFWLHWACLPSAAPVTQPS